MSDNPRQTVIDEGTEFDGVVVSECGIVLSGRLKGDVTAPSLTVNPSGGVDGKVRVEQLISRGEISGEIEADSIELSGRVSDRTVIRANQLEVKLNHSNPGLQVTFGDCELQVGGKVSNTGRERDTESVAVRSTVSAVGGSSSDDESEDLL